MLIAVNGVISAVRRCHDLVVLHRFGGHDASQTGVPAPMRRRLTTFTVASCARMRMTDIVRIGDILAGLISHVTSHTETRQRRWLVPAERLSKAWPKAAPGLHRISRCLPPKRRE